MDFLGFLLWPLVLLALYWVSVTWRQDPRQEPPRIRTDAIRLPARNWQRQLNRGRGPRNYQRRDERIYEDVNDRLTDSEELDATEIEVSVGDGRVTLRGRVADVNERQAAEWIAGSVSGVTQVLNLLKLAHLPVDY